MLHGQAAAREMCKLICKEMLRVCKEAGIDMSGCCPMHKETMQKCMKKGVCPTMKESE